MPSVGRLVDRAAAAYGDAQAVDDGRLRLSFRQVGERSSRLANALLALDSEAGGRVAMLMPNRSEWVEIDFAVAKAGLVRVPINPRLADSEREFVLQDSGAGTLIFAPEFEGFVEAARHGLPELRTLVSLGPKSGIGLPYEELLAKGSPKGPVVENQAGECASYILYTSGTTGKPKGAVNTNAGRIAATLNMLADEIDPVRGDAMLHVGSMAHGSGSKILAYFIRGAKNLPVDKFDPEDFIVRTARDAVTATFLVPTMIMMLLDAADRVGAKFTSLKTITYGGAPIATSRLEAALERVGNVFVQVYGSSEAPHPVTVLTRADHVVSNETRHRLSSIGRAVTAVEVRIVDANGNDAAVGEKGEIWVSGPNVMAGYWRNPVATAEVLKDGWYRTGDLATRDEQGFVYIVDRARDLIITGGLNVYPAEIEVALEGHPAVAEAAAIGIPDELWGESVRAFVVVTPGAAVTEYELIQFCQTRLAGYKRPRSIEFVESLPRGSSGKILKRELRARFWSDRVRQV